MEKPSTTTRRTAPAPLDERAEPALTTTLDRSRLAPPRSGGRVIPRERLVQRLVESRRRRCTVVKGPAGWGKTTVLLACRQQLLSLGFEVAWLSLCDDDNELGRFIDYLLGSLAQIDLQMVQEASLMEAHGFDSESVERTIITLVQGIASSRQEVVLVLDDLHSLTDVGIHQALQWLLDYAPANLHLVLGTRSAVPLSLARLRSQEQILELDLRDLGFTHDETRQFLRQQLGELPAAEVQQIHELTDGWIAGLQLLAASRRKPADTGTALGETPSPLRDHEAFARYFESTVLARLEPDEVELLVHTAVCNRFCPALCAALVNRPDAVAEALALLARLEQDNLFLIALDSSDPESWYRLHPLLRETLLGLFARRDSEHQRAVHSRAWSWLRERDQLIDAVRHAVAGGEAAAAAQLVEERLEALYAQGDLRILVELARLLPREQVQTSIRLRLLLARMQVFARDFAACEQSIAELDQDVPVDDNDSRFRVAMLRAVLAVQRDNTDEALGILPQLLNPPPGVNSVMIGGSLNILSWLYMNRGEYERARQVQLERPPLLVDGAPLLGTAGGTLQGRCLIGLSLAMEGQIAQAERIYREVIYEAQRHGRSCADARHLATALLGDTLYESNEIDDALQLLEPQIDLLERISIPDSVLRALEVLGKAHWVAGNRREAFAYLEHLDEYARRHQLDRLMAHALVWQVHWHLQLGEVVAAETKLARLDAIAARHPDAATSHRKDIFIIVENAHVRWDAAHGDLHSATLRLNRMIEAGEQDGRQLAVTRLKMLCAVFDAQRGQIDQAREKVMALLRTAQRFGQLRSVVDAHPDALQLIETLTRDQQLDPVLAFYVERLRGTRRVAAQPATAEAAPRATGLQLGAGMEPLSERELEVLRLLAQALPNKKIARALGLSHETVKWHLRHIYSKLGVGSRDEAVARLRDAETANSTPR
ncbi:LuxR C-terminal-related transcriptional regulator [Pseudomonas sp. BGr12]|uniref:LuxR C-terminal-related transcriptional regulator n=1 Tax=unclassified Pseudomonas TaxID=196821 RepID=UPI0017842C23|nr:MULTISPECIES: LuxR C-terminal-related transcriptional regulator [unclassified Pseudomonas]MBD9500591.1 AAA family ATPase [Pseudomonas sp. PDM17]MBD9577725.1 AAA family ATPase [Pseudomonas sp. PDM23]MBD9672285.1 AAA family ATPase [Pseudomonas sp. PDM21]MDL2430769.1 LuxR C-terminal-related transcriptional regulator [Pseudomonas sp. BJa5]